MVRVCLVLVAAVTPLGLAAQTEESGFTDLFDGRTLQGWEGDLSVFRVMEGSIEGGTLEQPIPQRDYLCTTRTFDDFELRVPARLEGAQNAGVHFRSHRIPGTNEVAGYQAHMGFLSGGIVRMLSDVTDIDTNRQYPLWGSLLDEFRQELGRYADPANPYFLLAVADRDVVDSALRSGDWNEVAVTAVGPRIQIRLNGVRTVDYTEEDDLVQDGLICLQVHDGGPSMAWYRDIRIRELSGV